MSSELLAWAQVSEDSPGILARAVSGIGVCLAPLPACESGCSVSASLISPPPAPLVAIISTSQCRSGDTEQITLQQQLRVMPASDQSPVRRRPSSRQHLDVTNFPLNIDAFDSHLIILIDSKVLSEVIVTLWKK